MPKIKRCEINDKGILSGIRGVAQFLASALELETNAAVRDKTIWIAVAERSGDTAFERAGDARTSRQPFVRAKAAWRYRFPPQFMTTQIHG
jgi:hypothetical protein